MLERSMSSICGFSEISLPFSTGLVRFQELSLKFPTELVFPLAFSSRTIKMQATMSAASEKRVSLKCLSRRIWKHSQRLVLTRYLL